MYRASPTAFLLLAVSCAAVAAMTTRVHAQEPLTATPVIVESTDTPTPPVATSPTPTAITIASTPPVATATAPGDATPIVGAGTIGSRVVVDVNGNGVFDDGDRPTATGVSLVAWDLVPEKPSVAVKYWFTLVMEDDTFSFTHVPAGRYSMRVYWIGGWVLGGNKRSPDIWQAIFDVQDSGAITAPDPATLPEFLPETYRGARIDIAGDHIWLGEPPDVLLALPKEAGVFPYPVDSGVEQAAIGTLDVARAMRGELPAAGTGAGAGDSAAWLPLVALGLVTASALAFALRCALRK